MTIPEGPPSGTTCSICGRVFDGWGHNPLPVRPSVDERCCEVCNDASVIPARLGMLADARGPLDVDIDRLMTRLSFLITMTSDPTLRKLAMEAYKHLGPVALRISTKAGTGKVPATAGARSKRVKP